MLERLGSKDGGWWVETDYVPKGSCVIDGGVGFDISFALMTLPRLSIRMLPAQSLATLTIEAWTNIGTIRLVESVYSR